DGVEVGVGLPRFRPAREVEVRVPDAPAERLWLRLRGDATSATAHTLERRALRADVDILPHNARWPADPIDVVVHVIDPSHRVDAAAVEPKLRVLLDIDEMPVTWQRSGTTFTAHIAPRRLLTNTVVRVEASAEHDNVLGRGFVEIEPSARPLASR
ncbi:MAG TPA: hypothetical protein VHB21_15035, partial [Minicystis sp.]|nr:hypothetical protein [Minicystis sp.]